ncbi:MAG: MarR family transcriptional regulator [Alphaproteobacteria bacterium]|nr:MarR family transcriptional regulator [Alphaproteobacteria bacterium]
MNVVDRQSANPKDYVLDEQIGYRLRLANQRHLEIFNRIMPDLTPTQFSVLVRLLEVGEVSQNHLGRMVATDAATTKGVISRLAKKRLVNTVPSQTDRRRLLISLTDTGAEFTRRMISKAQEITHLTSARLSAAEASKLMELLERL